MPKCTIGLLINAAHLAYRIEGEDNALRQDESRKGYLATQQLVDNIAQSEYQITVKTNAKARNSNGLTAVRLEPIDKESPVIISFRGTAATQDLYSNITLALTGTVEKKLRAEAFSFYERTKEQFPNRDIILVGHSLGGHLAQYVGTKAYATDAHLRESRSLHVRTFNTAPINTLHGQFLTRTYNHIFSQFCNYRLDHDVISALPGQQYYGNTFSFYQEKSMFRSHPLRVMRKLLPDSVKNLEIGGTSKAQRDLNTLKEAVLGIKDAYAAHIHGQWFSTYRMGIKNKKIIDKALKAVNHALKENPPNFEGAWTHLESARLSTYGPTSRDCLNCLIKDVLYVQKEYKASPEPTESKNESIQPSGPEGLHRSM
ncbi:Predicted lipase [Legionella steigerwaltii]|uniref:Lipase (Class 3) n=1 Tax=Legionella steigerwaltii TaxID=460 RepID=A0A378LJY7_9GAMM|nr:DUF6792 domain-containing protein [Legionella steigerwaltii]KTD78187.1 Lipase (class 3) [Legionella steigerwaltii]STY24381.1 Predicted lipase [Legionella steigerwaltii]